MFDKREITRIKGCRDVFSAWISELRELYCFFVLSCLRDFLLGCRYQVPSWLEFVVALGFSFGSRGSLLSSASRHTIVHIIFRDFPWLPVISVSTMFFRVAFDVRCLLYPRFHVVVVICYWFMFVLVVVFQVRCLIIRN
ncbi:hypothetical protein B9Z55_010764 [Caenorhabditis nigoni]|uniref:Transmembrane protein n=1 Tax=Caenorhabditis nigoni TaxID=1611254 RepID=A0A2G5UH75_9PELO|nr:hypothetical protein B9Z55_010764 [Caenorhabditis nigoni]